MLAVLGLGSNIGDSRRTVLDAAAALGQVLDGLRRASLYETEPMYVADQGRFINTAVSGLFAGTAEELLVCVNRIEAEFGRDRGKERRWGERTLDIDILLFGGRRIVRPASKKQPYLEIPHPRLKERRFALQPLLELVPDAVEPETGCAYADICRALPEQGARQIRL